jgi:hypothetical protein
MSHGSGPNDVRDSLGREEAQKAQKGVLYFPFCDFYASLRPMIVFV